MHLQVIGSKMVYLCNPRYVMRHKIKMLCRVNNKEKKNEHSSVLNAKNQNDTSSELKDRMIITIQIQRNEAYTFERFVGGGTTYAE